jgi:hypothetical protein
MVTHVTQLSRRSAYGLGMIVGFALLAALARLVEGELAAFVAFFLSCMGMGAVGAAWASMIASALDPRPGQGRWAALLSARVDRWAARGVLAGSAVGLALILLDVFVLA